MKNFVLFIGMVLMATNAHAESRDYKKVGANAAKVVIETDEKDSTQAATYLDGVENKKFIQQLLADPTSKLSKIKKDLELENCDETSKADNTWIEGCGEVVISDIVKTSFGRGGWAEGGAGYSFFIGFRSDGTGHFLQSDYLAEIIEDVTAQTDKDFNYAGTVVKTLSLSKIVKITKKN